MKCEYWGFLDIAKELSLRSDANFVFSVVPENSEGYYLFSDLFELVVNEDVDTTSLSTLNYVEISNITSTEDVFPVFLDYEDRNELNENFFKKIEKGDIIKVKQGDIIISKVRPYLKKYLLIDGSNNSFYYTSAFIRIHPKTNPKILFYALKSVFYQSLGSISRQGKGYPTLNEKDFYLMRFNKEYLDRLMSNSATLEKRITALEKEIRRYKRSLIPEKDIINSIMVKSFNLDIDELNRLDGLKYLSVDFKDIIEGSIELRDSVRFTKMRLIQQEMMRHYRYYSALDEYLLPPKTKNGWSPENNELEGETKLLGIDSLHFNGALTFENPKFTNETRGDIDNFYVKNGDFFVSRGNTVDLVALASIAENVEEEFLYPDIMIKLYVDETKIDKQFLAYLFNSIIGRLYFKYASKGKQQTMVKVSSDTIRNFIIPVIPLEKQRDIVKEIKNANDAQNVIKDGIKKLRNEIDAIIEKTLCQMA